MVDVRGTKTNHGAEMDGQAEQKTPACQSMNATYTVAAPESFYWSAALLLY
jgi:hypothetical protein